MASKTKEKNKKFLNKKRITTIGDEIKLDDDFMKKFNWWDYQTEKNVLSKLIASCKNSNLILANKNEKADNKQVNKELEINEKTQNKDNYIDLEDEKKKQKILGNYNDINSKVKEILFIYKIIGDDQKLYDSTEFYSLKEILEFLRIRCGFKYELLIFKDDESRNLFLSEINIFLEKYSQ